MILSRVFDEKALNLQRQGRLGVYASMRGQEASIIGSAYALKKEDWIFPCFRENGALILRGYPMHQLFMYWGGDERGMQVPGNVNSFPVSIAVGTQTLHAVGAAYANQYLNKKVVNIVYFGDGGTSEGDFHEAMNFAGVFQVPAIFICENNQYAISVPRQKQTHSETIAQKAVAYGIEGIQVDGMDVFAVYKAAKDAVDKARNGKGPTLIECCTYRDAMEPWLCRDRSR
jgi:pyruvate dehydrogenase E1 component alpha subunit